MSGTTPDATVFADLELGEPLLRALRDVGYEVPSPIQAATIPPLLSGRDVLGQAQTGTGKTAAFALPILARVDLTPGAPQALVLAPTRELAIQVAEAFQRYATHLPGFHVLPIYGGQAYGPQLSALRRGVQVVVGTPGRIIDHLEKGSLDLSRLRTVVLDEADEMLRMGFIDDVERILQKTPQERQIALFSATMPPEIKRIAKTYLRTPAEVTVAAKTSTADNIRQRYWLVSGMHKLDALTRILEAEPFDGMIIFSRTKMGTEELAEKLQARGFSAAAINGDLAQQQRERTVAQLKDGSIDILVATDVAARGLDVDRISHVINYDVPTDPESYVHRIGRTGRAGRKGEAILFITPRERGLLRAIERSTRQPVSMLELPTIQAVNNVRIAGFKARITETLEAGELELFATIIEDYERETNVPALQIAAALAKMSRRGVPLLLAKPPRDTAERAERPERAPAPAHRAAASPAEGPSRDFSRAPARARPGERAAETSSERGPARAPARSAAYGAERPARSVVRAPEPDYEDIEESSGPQRTGTATFRVEVGSAHGVKPGNIVGAIANESGMEARLIGRIEILEAYSLLEMPAATSKKVLQHLQNVQVAGRALRITEGGVMPRLRGSHTPPGTRQGAKPSARTGFMPGINAPASPHARMGANKPAGTAAPKPRVKERERDKRNIGAPKPRKPKAK